MRDETDKILQREILLSFWKVHILYHASEGSVFGQWMLQELRHHGYEVSPGTLYPLLARMEQHGWLRRKHSDTGRVTTRKEYRLTPKGREVLKRLQGLIQEMYREVNLGKHSKEE